jgi:hypothetical protein
MAISEFLVRLRGFKIYIFILICLLFILLLLSFSLAHLILGFECRCGGLYCAIHRYSDKHECTFDYREHGAAEIRRNNPVVVGEKIQKI